MSRTGRHARKIAALPLAGALLLSACDKDPLGDGNQQRKVETEREAETVDIPQPATPMTPGTTPMRERVAVIGLLNKRNGIARDLTMKPGEALRVGDVIVRLRACETTASWEAQKLTGAFLQVDVRNPQGVFQRVFSGWLFKETPSINVVEHPVYDVWPKSCAMTRPDDPTAPPPSDKAARSPSSAPKSAPAPEASAPSPPETPAPAADSNTI